jgi:hypothetical protein
MWLNYATVQLEDRSNGSEEVQRKGKEEGGSGFQIRRVWQTLTHAQSLSIPTCFKLIKLYIYISAYLIYKRNFVL